MKRKDYISWDQYFMGIAILSAQRSKDDHTQVGACLVIGCNDDDMPWEREGDPLHTKYFYVCHAELNAILNYGGGSLDGARVYVTLFPCNECAKAIIQSGMKEVIYMQDKYAGSDTTKASKKMFDMAGVKYRQFVPKGQTIEVDL